MSRDIKECGEEIDKLWEAVNALKVRADGGGTPVEAISVPSGATDTGLGGDGLNAPTAATEDGG